MPPKINLRRTGTPQGCRPCAPFHCRIAPALVAALTEALADIRYYGLSATLRHYHNIIGYVYAQTRSNGREARVSGALIRL
nr:MAG TPA: hypothetical protein [Caudoviricetes sp.]